MKTFKWTVPDLPMTTREKNLKKKDKRPAGFGLVVGGIFLSLMSLMYFPISGGFIKGIRTYFWTSGVGTILSSDLRTHSNSGGGTVTYSVVIDGITVENTTEVFKKWSGDIQAKRKEWESLYSQGRSSTVYYNRSGDTSLGHWPTSYSYEFGISAITLLFAGFLFIYRGAKKNKRT